MAVQQASYWVVDLQCKFDLAVQLLQSLLYGRFWAGEMLACTGCSGPGYKVAQHLPPPQAHTRALESCTALVLTFLLLPLPVQ